MQLHDPRMPQTRNCLRLAREPGARLFIQSRKPVRYLDRNVSVESLLPRPKYLSRSTAAEECDDLELAELEARSDWRLSFGFDCKFQPRHYLQSLKESPSIPLRAILLRS
jgi:hypothetical protein